MKGIFSTVSIREVGLFLWMMFFILLMVGESLFHPPFFNIHFPEDILSLKNEVTLDLQQRVESGAMYFDGNELIVDEERFIKGSLLTVALYNTQGLKVASYSPSNIEQTPPFEAKLHMVLPGRVITGGSTRISRIEFTLRPSPVVAELHTPLVIKSWFYLTVLMVFIVIFCGILWRYKRAIEGFNEQVHDIGDYVSRTRHVSETLNPSAELSHADGPTNTRNVQGVSDTIKAKVLTDFIGKDVQPALKVMVKQLPEQNECANEVITQRLAIAKEAAKTVTGCIENITVYDLVEGGQYPVIKQPCDIARVIDDYSHALAKKYSRSSVEFTLTAPDCAGNTASYLFDRQLLQQVLEQVLRNAFEHTFRGKVSLKWNVKTGECQQLRLVVKDTGEGIDEAQLAHVFEPYYQGKREKVTKKGVGLGLTIVRDLLQGIGGHIHISSMRGKGTSVHVSIPLCLKGMSDTLVINPFDSYRALVIGRSRENSREIFNHLKAMDIHVEFVSNTDAARGEYLKGFDFVFVDEVKIHGPGLMTRLLEQQKHQVIVCLSQHVDIGHSHEIADIGVFDIMVGRGHSFDHLRVQLEQSFVAKKQLSTLCWNASCND